MKKKLSTADISGLELNSVIASVFGKGESKRLSVKIKIGFSLKAIYVVESKGETKYSGINIIDAIKCYNEA